MTSTPPKQTEGSEQKQQQQQQPKKEAILSPQRIGDDYEVTDFLGKGAFAKVFKGRHLKTGKVVAIKVMREKSSEMARRVRTLLQRELEFWKALDSPHIVKVEDEFTVRGRICLVLEFVPHGSLEETRLAQPEHKFSERETRAIMFQLLSAIAYCHAKNVVHRDIKPDNLLFDGRGLVKLTDFGLCNRQSPGDRLRTAKCGSPVYMAPEAFYGNYDAMPADCWACGVVMVQFLSGKLPFFEKTEQALLSLIVNGMYAMPEGISAECQSLIQQLLKVNPAERLTAVEALKHPFFDKVSSKKASPSSTSSTTPRSPLNQAAAKNGDESSKSPAPTSVRKPDAPSTPAERESKEKKTEQQTDRGSEGSAERNRSPPSDDPKSNNNNSTSRNKKNHHTAAADDDYREALSPTDTTLPLAQIGSRSGSEKKATAALAPPDQQVDDLTFRTSQVEQELATVDEDIDNDESMCGASCHLPRRNLNNASDDDAADDDNIDSGEESPRSVDKTVTTTLPLSESVVKEDPIARLMAHFKPLDGFEVALVPEEGCSSSGKKFIRGRALLENSYAIGFEIRLRRESEQKETDKGSPVAGRSLLEIKKLRGREATLKELQQRVEKALQTN